MEHQLAGTQAAVASLRNLIEGAPAPIAIDFRAVGAFSALVMREHIGPDKVTNWCNSAFQELRAALAATGAIRAGVDAALFARELLENDYGEVVAFIPIGPLDTPDETQHRTEICWPIFQTVPGEQP